MILAHCGIAVFIVGVTMVKGFEVEQDLRMNVGETAMIGAIRFKFRRRKRLGGPELYCGTRTFRVTKDVAM